MLHSGRVGVRRPAEFVAGHMSATPGVSRAVEWEGGPSVARVSEHRLQRTVLVANQKGGVGKSSIVSGVAGMVADTGRRVLVVDGDQQGNVTASDLGVPEGGDRGRALAMALQYGEPLKPLRDVRPNLDVIAGGPALSVLGAVLATAKDAGLEVGAHLTQTLGQLIDEEGYDLVLIDSGPGDTAVLEQLLTFSRWLLVPTKDDDASLSGVELLAARYLRARREGAAIELLGVVLFDVNPRASARNREVFEQVAELLDGSGGKAFETTIRSDRAAAVDMRAQHMTPIELVAAAERHQKRRLEKLRAQRKVGGRQLWSRDPSGLATDYQNLTREMLRALVDREQAVRVGGVA